MTKGKQLLYTPDDARTVNDIARHQMICKLLADIRLDLVVCEIEGWDKKEYIRMLKAELNRIQI